TTYIYTLSLHDALPIFEFRMIEDVEELDANVERVVLVDCSPFQYAEIGVAEAGTVEKAPVGRPESSASGARKPGRIESAGVRGRSEEHTSELQSPDHLV